MENDQIVERELLPERHAGFRRLVVGLLALIAATFALMVWVVGSPDAYQEHLASQPPKSTWPDGSAKTANDWWAKANPSLAQRPSQPSSSPAGAPAQPGG